MRWRPERRRSRTHKRNWLIGARLACNHGRACRLGTAEKDRQSKYSLAPESQAFLISKTTGALAGFFASILPVMASRWLRLSDIVHDGRPAVAVTQEARALNSSVNSWRRSSR